MNGGWSLDLILKTQGGATTTVDHGQVSFIDSMHVKAYYARELQREQKQILVLDYLIFFASYNV